MMEPTVPEKPKPLGINHVAISVTNLEQAIKWYQEILGFRQIGSPV